MCWHFLVAILLTQTSFAISIPYDCDWGLGEHVRRFVRVPEDAETGYVAFNVNVSRPDLLKLTELKDGISGLLAPSEDGVGKVIVISPLNYLLTNEEEGSSILKYALYCGNNPVSQQVTVYIDDVNDHRPAFLDRNVTIIVDEMTPKGLVILPEIRVFDGDKPNTANSEIELFLEEQVASYAEAPPASLPPLDKRSRLNFGIKKYPMNSSGYVYTEGDEYFTMRDHKKGDIELVKGLDYDEGPKHFYLKIVAKDMGEPSLSSASWIHIRVKDSDDLNPVFTSAIYTATMHEHPGPDIGVVINEEVITSPGKIEAFDGDSGINTTLEYSLVDGQSSHFFNIDRRTGKLFLVKHLDRELLKESYLTVHLLARQLDNPGREGSAEVRISVSDVNDHLPYFENDVYAISIVENLPAGFSVVQVTAFDPDLGENGEFSYYVKEGNTPLTVNKDTGWLTVANQLMLDREKSHELYLEVCTKQKQPLAYLSKDIVVNSRKFELSTMSPTTRSRTSFIPDDDTMTTNEQDEIRIETTGSRHTTNSPTTITALSIDPQVRSLPPSALLRERLNREKLLDIKSNSNSNNEGPSRRQLLPKEETIGKLLASRRLLSQQAGKSLGKHGISKRDAKVTRGFRDKNGRFIPIQYLLKNGTLESPCASIKLTLLDANDNNPVFSPSNQYEFTIYDDLAQGEKVGTVKATDKDSGRNGVVRYKLQSQNQGSTKTPIESFNIDEKIGTITLKSPHLTPGHVTLFVEGYDSPESPSETRTSLAVVSITIKSRNTFEPQFLGTPYEFWVGAEAPIGTSVGQVRVTELDENSLIFDMFHSYAEEVPFGIEETSGIVAVTKSLHDFTRSLYDLEAVVTAPDRVSNKKLELATNVTIHVAPPPRSGAPRDIIVPFKVSENLAGGKVGDVLKALRILGVRIPRDPKFQLVSPEAKNFFTLGLDGILYTLAPLDYETKSSHTLVVVSGRNSLIFYVMVEVVDLNDNAPQFNAVRYEGVITENVPQGTTVSLTPHVKVTDLDSYVGSSWTVTIAGDSASKFMFQKTTNDIVFVGSKLDREEYRTHELVLKVTDDGKLSSLANLTISILDENDNAPKFLHRSDMFEPRQASQYGSVLEDLDIASSIWDLTSAKKESLLHISESLPIGSRITQLMAIDNDIGDFGKVSYSIENQTSFTGRTKIPIQKETSDFSIEERTGSVLVAKKLLPDSFYLLNITATDGGGLTSRTTLPISVYDINDQSPKFNQPTYGFEMLEGEYLVAEIGKVIAQDSDNGENGKIFYKIIPNATDEYFPFKIGESTGTILISGMLDREMKDKYVFKVEATDGGRPPLSDATEVHIFVEDVNDHPPEFVDYQELAPSSNSKVSNIPVYKATVSESAPPGSVIAKVEARDKDKDSSGSGLILYKMIQGPSSLAIDSQDGTIYTTKRLDYEAEPILLAKIVAQDMGDNPLSSTSILTVMVEDVINELSVRVFPQEVYEVHTFENTEAPKRLARIQLSPLVTKDRVFHLRLVDSAMLSTIHLDPISGDLVLIRTLDREKQSNYRFKIRAFETSEGRSLNGAEFYGRTKSPFSALKSNKSKVVIVGSDGTKQSEDDIYETTENPSETSVLPDEISTTLPMLTRSADVEALALDEAWINLVVNDVNDNPPTFNPPDKPLVAAVPSDAMIGDKFARIMAFDADEGINGELIFQLLPTTISSRSISYFALDVDTGELKVAGELSDIAGEMVSFDVRATDRRGEKNGLSSQTSAFIHVLEPASQLIIELNASPNEIDKHMQMLQITLTNISGFEIRVQKIAPHVDGDVATVQKTDVYIYGVDPLTKELIRSSRIRDSLRHRHHKISSLLPNEISMKGIRAPLPIASGNLLKSAELAILVGALVVFLACIFAIVCLCYRQRKRRRKPMPLAPGLNLGMAPTTAAGVPILPLPYGVHYPGGPYTHMSEQSDSSDSTHMTSPDHMGDKSHRGNHHPVRNSRGLMGEGHARKLSRGMPTVTNGADEENWNWRTRQQLNNEFEEQECVHACPHTTSPRVGQRHRGTSRSHWHIRESGSEDELNYGKSKSHREGCSRSQGTRQNCCSNTNRLPSPDSLERTHQQSRVPPSLANNHRKSNRLASDITEL